MHSASCCCTTHTPPAHAFLPWNDVLRRAVRSVSKISLLLPAITPHLTSYTPPSNAPLPTKGSSHPTKTPHRKKEKDGGALAERGRRLAQATPPACYQLYCSCKPPRASTTAGAAVYNESNKKSPSGHTTPAATTATATKERDIQPATRTPPTSNTTAHKHINHHTPFPHATTFKQASYSPSTPHINQIKPSAGSIKTVGRCRA